ncbi:hypothetical protein A1Q2_07049 [Trichosporon asahii var. asahii CBS 8904]|uniref:Uncharacterized protein n=2 Tax=Trichosporon asahii var. asahii TaxID=189963 RepID=K1VPL6_TRIAC|nr:hypothetical protein A1Q1_07899 [Trichosporon asahii var. asahii CBS 2479]EJT50926.1 hypothetical protein A1Q1_07899 [Trichosporon asahii var. asahii CBS 2479]EKC98627.1 hypothetical protein A1Q2_07049 [Trichosporon asahii var. asahii CBS 8904]
MLFLIGSVLLSLVAAATPAPYCNVTASVEDNTLLRVHSCNYQWIVSAGNQPNCPETQVGDNFVYKCIILDSEELGNSCDETYFVAAARRELSCPVTADRAEFDYCDPIPEFGLQVYSCPWEPYTE